MAYYQLRAEDANGDVKGWWRHGKLVADRHSSTSYQSTAGASGGLDSAERRWPQYIWRAFEWRSQVPADIKRKPKATFTREEVAGLLVRERERCALLCENEAEVRTKAGQRHPDESPERDRCFAGARAAVNCALGIRSELPHVMEGV